MLEYNQIFEDFFMLFVIMLHFLTYILEYLDWYFIKIVYFRWRLIDLYQNCISKNVINRINASCIQLIWMQSCNLYIINQFYETIKMVDMIEKSKKFT